MAQSKPLDNTTQQSTNSDRILSQKKPYQRPRILSREILEVAAAGCGKVDISDCSETPPAMS